METLSNTSYDQSTSSEEVPTNAAHVCRLRSGLNESCLIDVFEYLEWNDLLVLLKMDPFFKDIIFKWTLKKRMITLPVVYVKENASIERKDYAELIDTFETIGKSMRKFTASVSSLPLLLELIIQYCEPATLTEIILDISGADDFSKRRLPNVLPADSNLMDLSMPFFSNLRKFNLKVDHCVAYLPLKEIKILNVFTTKLLKSASKLKTLHIHGLSNVNEWLKYVKNLYELDVIHGFVPDDMYRGVTMDHLINSLTMNPQLKKFEITHGSNSDIKRIGDVLSKSCPNLEYFSEYQINLPYKSTNYIMTRYTFLSKMANLNHVQLISLTNCCCDLYYPLKSLAKSNIVHLEVMVSHSKKVNLDENVISDILTQPFPDFYNLHTFGLYQYGDDTMNFRFIYHFMKHLKNLKVCKVFGLHNIHKMLRLAPSIQVIGYWPMNLVKTNATDIVKTLQKIRRSNNSQHLLNLILPSGFEKYEHYFTENNANYTKNMINFFYASHHNNSLCEKIILTCMSSILKV